MRKNREKKTAGKRADPAASAHRIRIIGGQWKRTPLAVLDSQGLRPTPDRVRETVFNWLNHLLGGQWASIACLDLFAGTGALGFEAASRGASRVTMVESNTAAIRQLEATRGKLRAEHVAILRGDALSIANKLVSSTDAASSRFDLIFLDPPYHQNWLEKILPLCIRLLKDGGLVYAESEQKLSSEAPPDWLAGWDIVRADHAGMVFYHLLRRNIELKIKA
jgi:16S rRNA (guanine966-N2)-methyltransferase